MLNTRLLKAEITRNGKTRPEIADKLGISLYSLQKKINRKVEFRASEMYKLHGELGMNNETFMNIFFADDVDL